MQKILYVKITKCSKDGFWYRDLVGHIFNVVYNDDHYEVINSGKHTKCIYEVDCVDITRLLKINKILNR